MVENKYSNIQEWAHPIFDGVCSHHCLWFQDITDSDVEDASPEEMLLGGYDDNSDEDLNHYDVDICWTLFYNFSLIYFLFRYNLYDESYLWNLWQAHSLE